MSKMSKISKADKKMMMNLKKKSIKNKTNTSNKRAPINMDFLTKTVDFLERNGNVIFMNQLYDVIGVSKDTFHKYCREFDALNIHDEPILDIFQLCLSMNKNSINEQIRIDWLSDEKRTSPSERILLYKLCASSEEKDIINDTSDNKINNSFVIKSPVVNKETTDEYKSLVNVFNELDGD